MLELDYEPSPGHGPIYVIKFLVRSNDFVAQPKQCMMNRFVNKYGNDVSGITIAAYYHTRLLFLTEKLGMHCIAS